MKKKAAEKSWTKGERMEEEEKTMRKTIWEICTMIEMPQEVRKELELLKGQTVLQKVKTERLVEKLADPDQWKTVWKKIQEKIKPDENGFKMLFCMLEAAGYSYEKYQKGGISEKIFTETMKCFTRFVEEHLESFGNYAFDRDFWTGRQLSLQLFRIGELEYEKKEEGEISMHIPSDADLSAGKCVKSIEEARKFFQEYDPAYAEVPYTCTSWLLSPALKELLPENSRILQFQELFSVREVDRTSDEFLQWVYKRKDIPLEELPENTSLQRKMKEYLRKGGQIGEGAGVLKQPAV